MPEIATVSTSRQAGSHGVSQFAVGLGASPRQPSPPHRTMPAAATRLLFGPSRNTWKARHNLLLPCKVSKHIALLTRAAQRRVAVRSGKGNSNRPGRPLTTGMVRRGNYNIARWVFLQIGMLTRKARHPATDHLHWDKRVLDESITMTIPVHVWGGVPRDKAEVVFQFIQCWVRQGLALARNALHCRRWRHPGGPPKPSEPPKTVHV